MDDDMDDMNDQTQNDDSNIEQPTRPRTLRELVDDAIHQIDLYKNPSIDEFEQRFSEILKAARLGSLEHEDIESLGEYGGNIHLTSSWSARGCHNTSDYKIPSAIIDAPDPVAAARRWGCEHRLDEARRREAMARSSLESASAHRAKAQAELDALSA